MVAGGLAQVPREAGVYLVYRASEEPPTFLDESPAGHFKQQDPTVRVETLESKVVPEATVTYIGKADNLHRRLREFARFGMGNPVGHRGGRYIWQLDDSAELLVAWRTLASGETAFGAEGALMRRFADLHNGRLPFANIAPPRRS